MIRFENVEKTFPDGTRAVEGFSLEARAAARPTNAEIVDRLRSRDRADGVAADEILAARDAARR